MSKCMETRSQYFDCGKFNQQKQPQEAKCLKSRTESAKNSGIWVLARVKELIEGERMESIEACRRQYAAEYATSPESTPHGCLAWTGLKPSMIVKISP